MFLFIKGYYLSIIYNLRKVGEMCETGVAITLMLTHLHENIIQPLNIFTKNFITEYL